MINELGAERFAQDTNQELVEFYSVDKLSARAVDRKKWSGCEQARFKSLGPNLQNELWTATPATTNDHIPGCLKLCIGMPVMIKANEATELCITRGQEAIVIGWDSSVGPTGKRILDTLFVKLVKPPKPVKIPDLPLNVVPLGRTPTHITALLHDDSLLSINREQVMVLPNFAMTDYASQGKSRNPNVVHLNNCKDHRAYYVALSRGHEAADTVIVQGFDERKITGGLNGFLRQEFRELEILDEITRLRFEDKLPRSVTGIYRGQLIANFRNWKGNETEDPAHFHKAIKFNTKLDNKKNITDYEQWRPTNKEPPKKKTADTTTKKRKADSEIGALPTKKHKENPPRNQATINTINRSPHEPKGLIWNSTNYSCAYDALFTPLGEILQDNPEIWKERLTACSPLLGLWALSMAESPNIPENARDSVRRLLHFQDPVSFPLGPRNIKLDSLLTSMTDRRSYGKGYSYCEKCGYQRPGTIETLGQYIDISLPRSITDTHPQGMLAQEWFDYHFDRPYGRCPNCNNNQCAAYLRRVTKITELPTFLLLSISTKDILLEHKLSFKSDTQHKSLQLRGLIYHSAQEQHFTSVVVDKSGLFWYHDGMTTKSYCKRMINIKEIKDLRALHRIGTNDEILAAAMYAEQD
ncbi:hypothetical protein B0H13DRAFT_1654042 [Mycena leptocephala]|nr:hypothetical protein B0H13DRAFT_1654042 [Mycena leptocephala]